MIINTRENLKKFCFIEQNLENASLEQAVAALKGAPRGVVRIGVAKPLPLADAPPPLPAVAPPTID